MRVMYSCARASVGLLEVSGKCIGVSCVESALPEAVSGCSAVTQLLVWRQQLWDCGATSSAPRALLCS